MRPLRAVLAALAAALPASAQTAFGGARFTVISPELIRLEYQAGGKFVDEPSLFAVDRAVRFDGYKEERGPGRLAIDTGRIRLVYVPDGKPFSPGNLSAVVRDRGLETEWKPGMWSANDLGGARNLDGTKGPAPMEPGLLSRDGWRLLDDSTRPLLKDDWVAARPKDAGLDWYLFGYGHDYKAALRALTMISGPAPMPRKYVLGSWYSRWWPHSAKDYRRIVDEYRAHDFPLDVVVMDMDWHTKEDWTGYTWNKKLFPDPEGFLRWVHQQGLFATLNDHINLNGKGGVQPFEEHYADFMRALGRDPASKEPVPYDAGNRKQMDAFFSTVYAPLEKQGVDYWWLDYWDDGAKNPFNHLRWVNELYFRRSRRDGLRGQLFSRWADWGGQRHPIEFSGDSWILWPTLQFQVPFTANSGNAGAFFWAHDVGGYQGDRDGELLARWTQFAAFSAALRLHSMDNPDLDKRPWSYPKEIEDSMRVSFHLRSELFPYTYSSVRQTHEDSLPLVRPLYLEYPDDDRAYHNPQEYLYGDSFLVAPIVSSGPQHVALQKVWFPEGTWFSLFDGSKHVGPSEADFTAGLSSFPVFARGGVPIPMQPYTPRMGTEPLKTLIVRVYPGEDGKTGVFILYEDDGISDAYEKGAYALTRLEYRREGGKIVVSILPAAGTYRGQPATRALIVELPWLGPIRSAEAVGAVAHAFDRAIGTHRFDLGPRDIRRAVTLTVRVR
jgi:alpha-glucosidase (family GH31 glycosyl hydrolase)